MSAFRVQKLVRFQHCDPAGIVFYPQYFVLLNETLEDFFAEVLRKPFAQYVLEEKRGIPVVKLEVEFVAPSRLGEVLDIDVRVTRVGKSSLGLDYTISASGTDRVRARTLVVSTDGTTHRAVPFREDLNETLKRLLEPTTTPTER